jgi:hypothetical protein
VCVACIAKARHSNHHLPKLQITYALEERYSGCSKPTAREFRLQMWVQL